MKRLFPFLVLWSLVTPALSCTTFFINTHNQLLFGRNYDWVTGTGMICTNQRGLMKNSIIPANKNFTWISKYGSVSFNQYGKEFPLGGMNEQGLVVELMWNDGTKYPKADARPALPVLQWIQYQLDNHATVAEVVASDKTVRITESSPPLHFLVADATGKAATVEYANGKLVLHTGRNLPLPVLANTYYSESLSKTRQSNNAKGAASVNSQDNSIQRFATACSMIQQYNTTNVSKPAVEYSFDILNSVAQKGWTRWSIVYDMKNKAIHYKTDVNPEVKSFSITKFDFSCTSESRVLDVNKSAKGDVTRLFKAFAHATNEKIVTKAIEESKSQIVISDEEKNQTLKYANGVKCK
jgi:penicillin V acylase-like amidase (Ntn superfamily)